MIKIEGREVFMMVKGYVGICPICFEPIKKGEEYKLLEEGSIYHKKCAEEKPDSHYFKIETIYIKLWQYDELWVECGDVSNYVEGLEYKQKLLKYLMKRDLSEDICFYNGKVNFKINDMTEFNKINAYCNTRNEKYLD